MGGWNPGIFPANMSTIFMNTLGMDKNCFTKKFAGEKYTRESHDFPMYSSSGRWDFMVYSLPGSWAVMWIQILILPTLEKFPDTPAQAADPKNYWFFGQVFIYITFMLNAYVFSYSAKILSNFCWSIYNNFTLFSSLYLDNLGIFWRIPHLWPIDHSLIQK